MPDRRVESLLDLDPDLGVLLDGGRLEAARRGVRVPVYVLPSGRWDPEGFDGGADHHLALVIVAGVVSRDLHLPDSVSSELLGPGDVIRPFRTPAPALVAHEVHWSVLADTSVAVLDRHVARVLAGFPEIRTAILDRVNERAVRLAVTQAISQLNRVDHRLLAYFWHLAERWGRMTPHGVAVPISLPHRVLGQIIGARRPTVSAALRALAAEDQLHRREDGTWLLTAAPIGLPEPELERVVPIRRHFLAEEDAEAAAPADLAHTRERLESLRARTERSLTAIYGAVETSRRLAENAEQIRRRAVQERAARQARTELREDG